MIYIPTIWGPVFLGEMNAGTPFTLRCRLPALSCSGYRTALFVCDRTFQSHFGTTGRQTDRRTDGPTHDDSIYRASIASRGINI